MAAFRRLDRGQVILVKQFQDPLIMGDDYQRRLLLSKKVYQSVASYFARAEHKVARYQWLQLKHQHAFRAASTQYNASRVLTNANEGEDMSHLLPTIVKLLAHPDMCVKKLASEIVIQHQKDTSELVLLALNTLIQDSVESNPMIRGLALKTLSSLQHESATEHLERAILKALSDSSAQVRRIAVLSCTKLHQRSPSSVRDTGIIDTLYGTLRDNDSTVVVNCLSALEEILKEEGGMVINKAIAQHLVKKLPSFPMWSQVQVLDFLKKFTPDSEEEVFDIMNAADFCLEQNSTTVVITCLELFLCLLRDLPHLQSEVFRRSRVSLASHLSSGNVELIYMVINIILAAPKEAQAHFNQYFQSFFCRNRDPLYLKLKKIEILPQLLTEENGTDILEELTLYCVSTSKEVCLRSIQAVGLIHQEKPFMSAACRSKIQNLVQSSIPHVLSNVLQVLQDLDITNPDFCKDLLSPVCQRFDTIPDNGGKAAFLYLLGEHLRSCEDALLLLEKCVDDFEELEDRHVKINLLDAATKLYITRTSDSEGHNYFDFYNLLVECFELALSDLDVEVNSRANFLYNLLASDIGVIEAVLLNAGSK